MRPLSPDCALHRSILLPTRAVIFGNRAAALKHLRRIAALIGPLPGVSGCCSEPLAGLPLGDEVGSGPAGRSWHVAGLVATRIGVGEEVVAEVGCDSEGRRWRR